MYLSICLITLQHQHATPNRSLRHAQKRLPLRHILMNRNLHHMSINNHIHILTKETHTVTISFAAPYPTVHSNHSFVTRDLKSVIKYSFSTVSKDDDWDIHVDTTADTITPMHLPYIERGSSPRHVVENCEVANKNLLNADSRVFCVSSVSVCVNRVSKSCRCSACPYTQVSILQTTRTNKRTIWCPKTSSPASLTKKTISRNVADCFKTSLPPLRNAPWNLWPRVNKWCVIYVQSLWNRIERESEFESVAALCVGTKERYRSRMSRDAK